MHRTTVMLPRDLKRRAMEAARTGELSLGELIRRALEDFLERTAGDRSRDPFFADAELDEGSGPPDLAERHDDFLYGGSP